MMVPKMYNFISLSRIFRELWHFEGQIGRFCAHDDEFTITTINTITHEIFIKNVIKLYILHSALIGISFETL